MTILRKRIIFQHKDYPRGKTLPNLYAKFLFRVSVLPFYQNTCGDLRVATTKNYVEILNFRHFVKYFVFTSEGDKIRNKQLKKYINVSVVIDMECGNTK